MADHGSVTGWLRLLHTQGCEEAVAHLWEAYFTRLVDLARNQIRARPRPVADEEDVALSAFDSFVRAAQAGRFPRLANREDLWQVLVTLTIRKSIDLIDRENTRKAGSGRVAQLSALVASESGSSAEGQFALSGPTPDEVTAFVESLEQMLGMLGTGDLRQVVIWRLEGYTNAEIAGRLGRSVATVERKMSTARAIYEEAGLWASMPHGIGPIGARAGSD